MNMKNGVHDSVEPANRAAACDANFVAAADCGLVLRAVHHTAAVFKLCMACWLSASHMQSAAPRWICRF